MRSYSTMPPLLMYVSFAIWKSCADILSLVSFTIFVKYPSGLLSSLYGWSNSTSRPESITMTRSESIMVFNRCATVNTVQSAKRFLMVFWMNSSVLKRFKSLNFPLIHSQTYFKFESPRRL